MKRKEPIETLSHDRKHIYADYGDRMVISQAPRGSYGESQINKLPVRAAPKPPPPPPPPRPPKPSAREVIRQTLGLDTIGKRK